MKVDELNAYERILLLGYGREGKATETFLKRFCPQVEITIADEQTDPLAFQNQEEFPLAIKSPGVPRRKVKIPYTTATNIFFANVRDMVPEARIVGVTGSKGKSTTSSLIAHLLRQNGLDVCLAGNIGRPMLGELLCSQPVSTVFVLELSSYMLEDINFTPDISVFLNIFPEHLDYHEGLEPYVAAKSRIQAFAREQDYYVYDPEQPLLRDLAQKTSAQVRPWISDLGISDVAVLVTESPLIGEHNLRNIRAAATVAELFDISLDNIRQSLRSFIPLPHRLQHIGTFSGIDFYDDAIASAPEPTIEALRTLKRVDTLFLGGSDRGIDFRSLIDEVAQSSVQNLVFFPTSGERIATLLEQTYPTRSFNSLHTTSMKDAVQFAFKNTKIGSICLLSTASPSYSLWKDFEAKGDDFQSCVFKNAPN